MSKVICGCGELIDEWESYQPNYGHNLICEGNKPLEFNHKFAKIALKLSELGE